MSASIEPECYECDSEIPEDSEGYVVSGSGLWCSKGCWEEYHGQPYPEVEE